MNIEKIHIENYRGIKKLDLQLHPKLNVFIGDNASGKTSLLNAIFKSCVSLTSPFGSPKVVDSSVTSFSNSEVNNVSKFFKIESTINILSKQLKLFLVQGKFPEEVQKQQLKNSIDINKEFTQIITNEKTSYYNIPDTYIGLYTM